MPVEVAGVSLYLLQHGEAFPVSCAMLHNRGKGSESFHLGTELPHGNVQTPYKKKKKWFVIQHLVWTCINYQNWHQFTLPDIVTFLSAAARQVLDPQMFLKKWRDLGTRINPRARRKAPAGGQRPQPRVLISTSI